MPATSAVQVSASMPSAPASDTAAASRGTAAEPTGAWTMGCSIPSISQTGVRMTAAYGPVKAPVVTAMRDNGCVLPYRDDGIVLRTQKLGEADRIITVLGRTTGRVRAVAKGVRRTKSRFGARLEPFTHVDLMLHPGRSLDIITQAEVIRPYGEPLAGDYPRYTAGVAMLETAERFTPMEKEPALRQLPLLIGGLRSLGEVEHDPRLVLDAFLLRSLAVAGYAPALGECARCGASPGARPHPGSAAPASEARLPAFAVAAGGMVC